ncbi:MAG: FAD-binding oxidoreductase [Pseudomonadota bacterium]
MSYKVAIIGGGVIGTSIAWHLADRGGFDVSLYEREKLSSGTTWHSAGNITWGPEEDQPDDYMMKLVDRLHEETGQDTGWRTTGRLHLACSDASMDALKLYVEDAKALGHAGQLFSGDEVTEFHPLASPEHIVGEWRNERSGRLNPTDLVNAFAKGARDKGVKIFENGPIKDVIVDGGRVRAIETFEDRIDADIVVMAAGLWSRDLLKRFDIHLGMSVLAHSYLIAETDPVLSRDTPSFECPEFSIFGREEVGRFLVGFFDDNAKVVDPKSLPELFSFALLQDDIDQIAPYYESAMRLFPALSEAPIRNIINGPETFTLDGDPIVGGFEYISGLYVACGMNSGGVTFAGMVGHHITDLLTGAKPRFTEYDMRPERFGDKARDEAWVDAEVSRVPYRTYTKQGQPI